MEIITKTITAYEYNELSDDAKRKIRNGLTDDISFINDIYAQLEDHVDDAVSDFNISGSMFTLKNDAVFITNRRCNIGYENLIINWKLFDVKYSEKIKEFYHKEFKCNRENAKDYDYEINTLTPMNDIGIIEYNFHPVIRDITGIDFFDIYLYHSKNHNELDKKEREILKDFILGLFEKEFKILMDLFINLLNMAKENRQEFLTDNSKDDYIRNLDMRYTIKGIPISKEFLS